MIKRQIDKEKITYGQLVDVRTSSGFTGGKVHFFNHRGVLVGGAAGYKIYPYDKIYERNAKRVFEKRLKYDHKGLKGILLQFIYECLCKTTSFFIRKSQNFMMNKEDYI